MAAKKKSALSDASELLDSSSSTHDNLISGHRPKKRLNVNVDASTYEVFKTLIDSQGGSIQDTIMELIEGYMTEHKARVELIKKAREL